MVALPQRTHFLVLFITIITLIHQVCWWVPLLLLPCKVALLGYAKSPGELRRVFQGATRRNFARPVLRAVRLCFGHIRYSGMEVWAGFKACEWEEGYVGMSRNKVNRENPFCYPAHAHRSSGESVPVFLSAVPLSCATSPEAFQGSWFQPRLQGWAWLGLSQSVHCILHASDNAKTGTRSRVNKTR